jgi:acyl-coenzyme A thioesterase PaaI-like protein
MKDWSALEEAAGALRRLNRAVAGRDVPDDVLHDIARAADALADELAARPVRDKGSDMATVVDLAAAMAGQPVAVAVGDRVEFDPFSSGGGRLHPAAIGLDVRRDGKAAVVASVRVDPMFQGPPGRVHGGVLAVLIDELMGSVNRVTGRRAYTARLALDLRAAAPIDTELTFRAWLHDQQERKVTIRADGRVGSDVFLEAEGLFIVRRPETDSGAPPSLGAPVGSG